MTTLEWLLVIGGGLFLASKMGLFKGAPQASAPAPAPNTTNDLIAGGEQIVGKIVDAIFNTGG